MNLFSRPPHTYAVDPAVVKRILATPESPLRCIAELITPESMVLDIGAGNGLLSDVLAGLGKHVTIDGIEPDQHAAVIARPKYRNFHEGTAESLYQMISNVPYDTVVLADVIEHTVNPETFLAGLISVLGEDTKLIASIPNCAFGSVRLALLDGSFPYADSGLLERTHLRFFTLDTVRQLAGRLGLSIERVIMLERSILKTELRPRLHVRDLGAFLRICGDPLASVYQFITVFSRKQGTSIVERRGHKTVSPLFSFLSRWAQQTLRRRGRQ